MNDRQEIMVKILIFFLVLILLLVEVLQIDITIWTVIITALVLVLTFVIIVVEVKKVEEKKRKCDAFIYQHKELGTIEYCENDEGEETRDFKKIGQGKIRCDLVGRCSFAR